MIFVQRPDLARLKDSRNGDADDEDQSHRPVNGTVVECVEDREQDETGTADNAEEDGKPIKDLLPCPEVHGQSVDMSQPPLGEQRQDVESSGHTADTDKQCLVDSTDVRDEDDTCFIASVSWFSVGNP